MCLLPLFLTVIPLGTAEYFLEMPLKWHENSRQKQYKSPFSAQGASS